MDYTFLIDTLTSKNVNGLYKYYGKTQWFNNKEMRGYQYDKLIKLIDHCYRNVPFYREYMDNNGFKVSDIKSIDDIIKFPIITKEIIKNNYEKFIPKNLEKIKGVKTKQTGGTTGNILFVRTDANTRSSTWATYKRFQNDWMGIKSHDKKMILMGGHIVEPNAKSRLINWLSHSLSNETSYDIYNTSLGLDPIIDDLQNNRFDWIRSYSQFLFSLAQRLEKQGLFFNFKAISTTAEPLTQEHRQLFRKVFNAETFDQYGCGEIGGIAYECDHHQGLHVAEERVIFEINKKSEVIVTDLDNYAMPFIRYWNADQVELSKTSCSCGRNSLLIKKVLGRTCDYILGLNGEFLHWAYFWHLFFDSNIAKKRDLKKFQVVQETRDELLLRLVSDILSIEEQNFFIADIQKRLGPINIKFSFENDIENTQTGKYRPVISKIL